MASLDLERLLRDLSATLAALRTHAEARRESPEVFSIENPYERRRWVSNLSTLQQLDPADPAWPLLASWILWLLLARTCHEAEGTAALARVRSMVRLSSPTPEEVPLREAVHRLIRATTTGERGQIAQALEVSEGRSSEPALELWMRRGEVLRRAGDVAKWTLLQPLPSREALASEAEGFLAATDDLAREVLGQPRTWSEALALGLGQAGDVPWPKRLSPRWILSPFEGEAGWLEVPGLRLGTMPELVGGSSVTRALARLGARWADAAAPRHLPAPLATHPAGLARMRTGGLVASLLLAPSFLQRGLGFGRAEAARAQRQQGQVLLVATRLEATRVLLLLSALQGDRRATRQEAAERTRRAIGAPIPEQLALVLPRIEPTTPARFLAAELAALDARAMQQAHDDDWYRNPKAVLALRDRLDRAPEPGLAQEQAQAGRDALAQKLTEILA